MFLLVASVMRNRILKKCCDDSCLYYHEFYKEFYETFKFSGYQVDFETVISKCDLLKEVCSIYVQV